MDRGMGLKSAWSDRVQPLLPGLIIAGITALAAQFISDHYGAPAMLMALLFGIAVNFLSKEPSCAPGIAFTSRTVLRLGVALLGLRITYEMAASLGPALLGVAVAGVVTTIGFGIFIARFFGYGPRFGFLSAGAVAICGASAALAISAVLPKDDRSEERLVFTVVGVTVLSTIAMVLYPILTSALGFDTQLAGVFLGATIHDVAQVVGAGFSVSEEVGELATLVKLIRVAMLAPVILIASLIIRAQMKNAEGSGDKPPILPSFVVGFLVLVTANSFGLIPTAISELGAQVSRWALLAAIAAVGVKTSLKDVVDVGGRAIGLIVTHTLFIAVFTLGLLELIQLSR
ncbi:MAG: YeiH family protein [Pseudomonadota bacterium]